jgi:hypothetical protein
MLLLFTDVAVASSRAISTSERAVNECACSSYLFFIDRYENVTLRYISVPSVYTNTFSAYIYIYIYIYIYTDIYIYIYIHINTNN